MVPRNSHFKCIYFCFFKIFLYLSWLLQALVLVPGVFKLHWGRMGSLVSTCELFFFFFFPKLLVALSLHFRCLARAPHCNGFPGDASGKRPACQSRRCKRLRFDPWVRTPFSRKWRPTPVFLHGKSHGQRSLVGCNLQGRKESHTTEAT